MSESNKPKLIIEVDPATGDLKIDTKFSQPRNEQEASALAFQFGTMLYMLNTGELLPLLQFGVSKGCGETLKGLAFKTLGRLNSLMEGKDRKPKLVVRPTKAFGGN